MGAKQEKKKRKFVKAVVQSMDKRKMEIYEEFLREARKQSLWLRLRVAVMIVFKRG